MNFSYGIIGIVGVLAAISIGFIVMDPTDVIEPPVVTQPEPPVVTQPEPPVVTQPEPPVVTQPEPTPEPTPELESLSLTTIVSIPPGAAVLGCENTNECYLPYEINVAMGTTVSWSNDDSTTHTVTSGTVTAGMTDVFDSSLFRAGDAYEFTFDKVGTYDYFCVIHPWMTGIVNVN